VELNSDWCLREVRVTSSASVCFEICVGNALVAYIEFVFEGEDGLNAENQIAPWSGVLHGKLTDPAAQQFRECTVYM
jgi:hypothetical protein